ncbi:GNAT family N-acetyltransferase [Janibacter sp. Soil728]|uniref:GNAT family N-acetyltransferase n=1 Tax=Janibacter sp. Soil728 TaxID=1736393 RepID=UPI000A77BD42|nr:GNAT family N-acetyltransferase [Janibacter sp. Soil728]
MTLLEHFHAQIRLAGREDEPRPGLVQDSDGPVRRTWSQDPTAFAMVECPAGLGEDPDHWISRQVDFFAERGQELEWKTYDYDEPADLLDRLRAHGFTLEDDEALVLGEVADLLHPVMAKGASLRLVEAGDDAAFAGIADLHEIVWGRRDGHTQQLRDELRRSPETLDVFVAEASEPMEAGGHRAEVGQVVCGAWVRYSPGTDFCSLWGGTTHPAARRRGIYRALVAERAQRASRRGFRLVRVDCSPDSLPILTRLGLERVATTVPATRAPAPAGPTPGQPAPTR